jgi:hypothetical protein
MFRQKHCSAQCRIEASDSGTKQASAVGSLCCLQSSHCSRVLDHTALMTLRESSWLSQPFPARSSLHETMALSSPPSVYLMPQTCSANACDGSGGAREKK